MFHRKIDVNIHGDGMVGVHDNGRKAKQNIGDLQLLLGEISEKFA